MNKLIAKIFLVVFVGLLIICGFAMHELEQSLNKLDTALDNLSDSLTELELVMDDVHEGEEE